MVFARARIDSPSCWKWRRRFDVKGLPTVYLSSRDARDSPVQMEVQGSADEIVPNMLKFITEQTAAMEKGDRGNGGSQDPSKAELTDEDRDL